MPLSIVTGNKFRFNEFVKSKDIPCPVGQITGTGPPVSPGKGTDRDRHETCGEMRWTLRRQAGLLAGRERSQRTAKSCGPGAATVASILREVSRRQR